MLAPIIKKIEVPCDLKRAFEIFTDFNCWWPLDKRSMSVKYNDQAESVSADLKVGGQIIEHSAKGIEYLWGTIIVYEPYYLLSMNFHMGLPPCDSTVEVKFEAVAPNKSQVILTQSNWEAFGDMAEMMRGGYGSSWGLLFEQAYHDKCSVEVG